MEPSFNAARVIDLVENRKNRLERAHWTHPYIIFKAGKAKIVNEQVLLP